MKKIKFLFALAASSFALSSFAQTDWPNKPIQIIVTFAPGGTSDVLARAIAPDLSKALGQPVLVVNKPGANSTIATREVARSAPDGNTIGLFISAHAINPHITKSLQEGFRSPCDARADAWHSYRQP
jgi:tripartite-type tricarboxylate transporter receptor subunit TctC